MTQVNLAGHGIPVAGCHEPWDQFMPRTPDCLLSEI